MIYKQQEKESTPCAANPNLQNPTPAAAPSQSPSPGTARGASTGTFAPGGQTETPDRSKLYFKKAAYLVYRFSETGQFQFWLFSGKPEWKPSDFLNLTYARQNRENLKPPSQWLAEYADSHEWPEITQKEFDEMCKNMNAPTAAAAATTAAPAAEPEETLTTSGSAEDAKTSQAWTSGAADAESLSVRPSLVDTAPATQSLSDAGTACLEAEPERPSFDYSGLDAQTVEDLHLAEREYIRGKRLAETGLRRMADGVAIAHEALCVTDATICRNGETGKFSKADQTFGAWCESVGLNRKAAERLLQVSTLFDRSSPKEQKVLADLAPSLLYAAAKPSAPEELVQGVKEGSITTHKQYQELQAQLKAEKDRADTAEAERDAARSEKAGLAADCNRLGKAASDAKRRAQTAEAQRDAALADVDGLSQQNTRLQEERDSAEKRASETEKQLEGSRQVAAAEHSRAEHWKEKAEAMTRQASAAPIEAKVVDTDEVERLAAEKAEALAAQQMAQRDAKDARDAYDAVILATRSMDAAWQALAPMLPRLAPEEKSQAIHQFVQKLMCIKEDVLKCL